jgi:IPT/TIG domain
MRAALVLAFVLTTTASSATPAITSLFPSAGYPWGGTQVHISGNDLLDKAFQTCYDNFPCEVCPIRVYFGNVLADVIDASPGGVTLVTPPHGRGLADVTIKVPGRPDAFLADAFEFDDLASESSVLGHYYVPVSAIESPGANGSIWNTEFTIHNPTQYSIPVLGQFCENTPAGCEVVLAPNETKALQFYPGRGESSSFSLPINIQDQLIMSLRVRDLSRQSQDWGSQLPLVPLKEFIGNVKQLLDVPVDPGYRTLLRAFGNDEVIVRVHPLSGTEILDERRFDTPLVAVDPITPAVRASGHERVRVVVEFTDGALNEGPYSGWAFITLTNNITQHVTIITPQTGVK